MNTKLDKYICKLLILLCIICPILSINQKCKYETLTNLKSEDNLTINSQCPINSVCQASGYCVCNQGYFGNCQTKGNYLNMTVLNYTITQKMSYFIIQPSINQYIYYKFQLCNQQQQSNSQVLNLWSDDGNMIQPSQQNPLGNNKIINVVKGCTQLMTPFFVFQNQSNGQRQLLIFGIRLLQSGSLNITLKVEQSLLFGFEILYRVIFILISGVGLISILSVVYCIYKCKRRGVVHQNMESNLINIDYFDQFMPSNKVKLGQIRQQICAVCLIQYEQNQQLRNTICGHHFHKTCLDEWCVTHLNCPICRMSFQKANLIEYNYMKSSRVSSTINSVNNNQNDHQDNHQSIIYDDTIQNQVNLRKPII